MNLEEMIEQCTADSKRWFPITVDNIPLLALCISGEVGECCNLVKKIERGSLTVEEATNVEFMNNLGKDTLQEEIVDVLIYLCNLMGAKQFANVDWNKIWNDKRAFNENRFGWNMPTKERS